MLIKAYFKHVGALHWAVYSVGVALAHTLEPLTPQDRARTLEVLRIKPLASGMTEAQADQFIAQKENKKEKTSV